MVHLNRKSALAAVTAALLATFPLIAHADGGGPTTPTTEQPLTVCGGAGYYPVSLAYIYNNSGSLIGNAYRRACNGDPNHQWVTIESTIGVQQISCTVLGDTNSQNYVNNTGCTTATVSCSTGCLGDGWIIGPSGTFYYVKPRYF